MNKVRESIFRKTTNRYSKLYEEYRDLFKGIGQLKGVQVKYTLMRRFNLCIIDIKEYHIISESRVKKS